jgi:hypothetical protein
MSIIQWNPIPVLLISRFASKSFHKIKHPDVDIIIPKMYLQWRIQEFLIVVGAQKKPGSWLETPSGGPRGKASEADKFFHAKDFLKQICNM